MSLGDHLTELSRRLWVCVLAFLAVFIGGMFFYQELWSAIRLPLRWAAASLGKPVEEYVHFQWLGPLDPFLAMARVTLFGGFLLVLPILVYELWMFVAPGLTRRERQALVTIFTAGSGLFLLGVAVAFFLALPVGLQWLLWFSGTLEGAVNQWTLDYYLGFVTLVCVGFGLAFETPLVMYALARVGLIGPQGLRRYWRHAILLIVVLAAIFTPPDPFTQIILASFLLVLYGIGYLLVCSAAKKRLAAD